MSEVLSLYNKLSGIARDEFSDIVSATELIGKKSLGSSKLRIHLKDGTYIDVWVSGSGKYSYHWEQRAKRGLIYRHDNAPDFPEISTFPKHFHDGTQDDVKESYISDRPEEAVREFLKFARQKIKQK
ncbi:MAG: hypothetical protein HY930_02880 [Euryarchaeota archaeon]|nr:hypothetical protein [Euryarchaeota archaeon]